jgi:hypothetical protein
LYVCDFQWKHSFLSQQHLCSQSVRGPGTAVLCPPQPPIGRWDIAWSVLRDAYRSGYQHHGLHERILRIEEPV